METIVAGGEWHGNKTFKSYYVVWKLFKDDETTEMKASLNRTMQYGNSPPVHFHPTVPPV